MGSVLCGQSMMKVLGVGFPGASLPSFETVSDDRTSGWDSARFFGLLDLSAVGRYHNFWCRSLCPDCLDEERQADLGIEILPPLKCVCSFADLVTVCGQPKGGGKTEWRGATSKGWTTGFCMPQRRGGHESHTRCVSRYELWAKRK